jgi:hypothetical protein
LFTENAALASALGDGYAIANAPMYQGFVAVEAGDDVRAYHCFMEAIQLQSAREDPWYLAPTLEWLARLVARTRVDTVHCRVATTLLGHADGLRETAQAVLSLAERRHYYAALVQQLEACLGDEYPAKWQSGRSMPRTGILAMVAELRQLDGSAAGRHRDTRWEGVVGAC